MTLWTIQNDYLDHVRHVWDIFETIQPLKIIFLGYIFENFRLKISKITFFGILWLYKGTYYLFKLRNEEFRWLRSEYMTLGRKVLLFFAKKKCGFFVQWSFPKRVLYFLTPSNLRNITVFYKLKKFHKMSKLPDCQI